VQCLVSAAPPEQIIPVRNISREIIQGRSFVVWDGEYPSNRSS